MQEDGKDLKPAFEHLMPDLGNWDAAEMTKIMDQAMQVRRCGCCVCCCCCVCVCT